MTTTSEDAIRRLVDRANDLQGEREPFLALHTEDAIVVNIVGLRVLGREALDAAMRRALASKLANVVTRTEVDDVTFVRSDAAVVSCTRYVEDRNNDASASALPLAGTMSYLVVDDGEGWRIALAQTTPRA